MINVCFDIRKRNCVLSRGFETVSGKLTTKTFIVVEARASGEVGYGEIALSPSLKAGTVDENMAFLVELVGKSFLFSLDFDVFQKEVLDFVRDFKAPVQCGLSNALLDLYGKIASCSVLNLFHLFSVPVKTVYTLGYGDVCPRNVDAYQAVKVKQSSVLNKDYLQKLQKRNLKIWIDFEKTLSSEKEFENYFDVLRGVELIEDPFDFEPDERWLNKPDNSLIFADWYINSLNDIEKYAPFVDGVVIKPIRFGGIIPAMQAINYAKELKLKVLLGCYTESVVSLSAWAILSCLVDFHDLDGAIRLLDDEMTGLLYTDEGVKLPVGFGLGVRCQDKTVNLFDSDCSFNKYSHTFHDALYDFEQNFLKKLNVSLVDKRVLILGFGTGREIPYFLEKKAWVYGVEAAQRLYLFAKEHILEEKCHLFNAKIPPFPTIIKQQKFDLIWASYNFLSHITSFQERQILLKEIKNMLTADGLCVFSYHNRNLKKMGMNNVGNLEENCKYVPIVPECDDSPCILFKFFSTNEINHEFEMCGLNVIETTPITELTDKKKLPWSKTVCFSAAVSQKE